MADVIVSTAGTAGPIGTAQTGQAEVIVRGGWQKTGTGTAKPGTVSSLSTWDSGSAELRVTFVLNALPEQGRSVVLVVVAGSDQEYGVDINGWGGMLLLLKSGGNYPWAAVPTQTAGGVVAPGATITLEVTTVSGNRVVKATVGTTSITRTDSVYKFATTKIGVAGGSPLIRWSNLRAIDLASVAPPPDPPAAPTGVTAVVNPADDKAVLVSWTPTAGTTTQIEADAVAAVRTSPWTHSGLQASSTHTYRARAYNSTTGLYSSWTTPLLSVTLPDAPPPITGNYAGTMDVTPDMLVKGTDGSLAAYRWRKWRLAD